MGPTLWFSDFPKPSWFCSREWPTPRMAWHFGVGELLWFLEPQTTIYKWMFQLDDSKSLYRKWLFHQTSIYKWLFWGSRLLLCHLPVSICVLSSLISYWVKFSLCFCCGFSVYHWIMLFEVHPWSFVWIYDIWSPVFFSNKKTRTKTRAGEINATFAPNTIPNSEASAEGFAFTAYLTWVALLQIWQEWFCSPKRRMVTNHTPEN